VLNIEISDLFAIKKQYSEIPIVKYFQNSKKEAKTYRSTRYHLNQSDSKYELGLNSDQKNVYVRHFPRHSFWIEFLDRFGANQSRTNIKRRWIRRGRRCKHLD
jgi:hypothetical protein